MTDQKTIADYVAFGFAPFEFDEYTAPVVTSLTRVATEDGREYLSDRFVAILAYLIDTGADGRHIGFVMPLVDGHAERACAVLHKSGDR